MAMPPRARTNSVDYKVDPMIAGLGAAAVKEFATTGSYENNKYWQDIRLRLVRCSFNVGMTEAAVKSVKKYASGTPKEQEAFYHFYNQMLLEGKHKAFAVIKEKKHADRLFAAATNQASKGELMQVGLPPQPIPFDPFCSSRSLSRAPLSVDRQLDRNVR